MNKLDIVTCLALSFLFISLCSFRHSGQLLNDEDCMEGGAHYTLCYSDKEENFVHYRDEETTAAIMPSTNIVIYIPLPENELRATFRTFTEAVYESTGRYMKTVISISPTESNTVIYYDHWEDGYEADPENPTQPTTEIWGDQDSSNGVPPGSTTDLINSGNVIPLENTIRLPRNPAIIRFDGRDKITSTKFIALSKSCYPLIPGPVLAGSVEVVDTSTYGTFYEIPIGESFLHNDMFEHISLSIMASENETALEIDVDGDGIIDINTTINEGENYFVRGRASPYYNPIIKTGATISSSKPVQAHMIAGDLGGYYETRFFTLYPKDLWDNCYYSPVGTTVLDDPAYVLLYNPSATAITVFHNTLTGAGSFSIPAKDVYEYEMPFNSGAHFYTVNPSDIFFGIVAVDANEEDNSSHDWGFSLLPERYLSCSGVIGWGPGNGDLSGNGNPVWVTAIEHTTVYVDFDNNPYTGQFTDSEGNKYDQAFNIVPYESIKVFDYGDNDQTGARIYTLNGARIAMAWGQDPITAEPGNPYLDLGTTVTPEQKIVAVKRAEITNDQNGNGLVDPGDEITFHLHINNQSLQTDYGVYVTDTIPTGLTYQVNTTSHNGTSIPDNTPVDFPLFGTGYYLGDVLPYQYDTISFVTIANADIFGLSELKNRFYAITDDSDTLTATVILPINQIEATSCFLDFTDADGVSQSGYREDTEVCVTIDDNDNNIYTTSIDSISVTIYNLVSNDWETIQLLETEINSGIFRACVPASASNGQMQEDGTLYAVSSDVLSATYLDQTVEDACSESSSISLLTEIKQLYLTDALALDRIDPVASEDGTTSISIMPSGAGGSLSFTQTPTMCQPFRLTGSGELSANCFIHVTSGSMPANPDITATIRYNGTTIYTLTDPILTSTPDSATYTVRDEFDAADYSLNHGYTNWLTDWSEVDEGSTSPSSDQIIISGGKLQFKGTNSADPYIFRQANISSASSAILSYDISGSGTLDAGPDKFEVQISDDGGFLWTSLKTYDGNADLTESIDISSYMASNTAIRFNIKEGVLGTDEFYTVDNVQIEYNVNGASPIMLTWDDILPLSVTIPAGEAITLEITNNEAGVDFNILYDSESRASFLSLPTSTVITIDDLSLYDAPYPGGSPILSAQPNEDMCIRTTVGDPFGAYDINNVALQIISPSNVTSNIILDESNTVFTSSCNKIYEYCFNVGNDIGSYQIELVAHEGLENTVTDTTTTTTNITLTDLGSPCHLIFTDTLGNPKEDFNANETICITLSDTDKNINENGIDTVIVIINTINEDTETLIALETGISSGIFQACLLSNSIFTGADEDGVLYAPPGALLDATYNDTEYPNDVCISNALINSGVPDIAIAKKLASHSDSTAIIADFIQFDIVVGNPGTTLIPVAGLEDNYDETCLQFDSASVTPDIILPGLLIWNNVGPLPSGEHVVINTYFSALDVCSPAINEVSVDGVDITNTNLSDGPDTASIYITNPLLTLEKTLTCLSGGPYYTVDIFDYEIYIENTGTTTITTLPLSDFSSIYCLELIEVSPIQPDAVGGGTILWSNLGPLAPGESISLRVSFRALNDCDPALNTADISYAVDENGDAVPPTQSQVSIQIESYEDTLSVSSSIVCIGDDAEVTISNSEIGMNYELLSVADGSSAGTLVPGTGSDINYIINDITESTYYHVIATNIVSGCRELIQDSLLVSVYPALITNPDSVTVCTQSTAFLNGNPSGGSGTFTTHLWTDLNTGSASGYNLLNTNNQTLTADLSTATTGTIELLYSVTDNNGCTTSDTGLININGISGHLVTDVTCDDAGTIGDPTDDTFTFTLEVNGTGETDWRGLGQIGQFNQAVTMGPFPIYSGDITGIITSDLCNLELPVSIPAPDACSTEAHCELIGLLQESFCCRTCSAGNILTYISHMGSFEVLTEQNIAIGKPTSISSRAFSERSNPDFAVDGITDGNSNTNEDLVISAIEETPWWEIDLSGNFNLTNINIYGRTDCCTTTNYDYTILVSNNPFTSYNLATVSTSPGISVFTHSQTGGNVFTIPANRAGRFIRIYLQNTNQLQLAEVQVMGTSHASTNPYSYTWSDPAIGDQSNPDCLAPGNYSLTIEDTVTGCEVVKSIVID